MDLNLICRHIYYSVISTSKKASAPIAYITLRAGKNFPFTDAEIDEYFNRIKWNTSISTADLVILRDKKLTENYIEVEEIAEFIDDEGNGSSYRPDEKNARIFF